MVSNSTARTSPLKSTVARKPDRRATFREWTYEYSSHVRTRSRENITDGVFDISRARVVPASRRSVTSFRAAIPEATFRYASRIRPMTRFDNRGSICAI